MASFSLLFAALVLLRLLLFGLALGLTIISFQAYSEHGSQQLEYAFVGFAFISMGTAMSNLTTQAATGERRIILILQLVETLPFIVGFSMLYVSLYE